MEEKSNKRGRPHGGKCWLIKKGLSVLAVEHFNNVISMVKIETYVNNNKKNLYIFGVWVPFDNATAERLAAFQTTLTLLEAYIQHEIDPNEDLLAIIGDFNCDTNRNNRFDAIFKNFIFVNNLFDSLSFFDQEISYTYMNGDYKSSIDHIVCNHSLFQQVTAGEIMCLDSNLSDHNPVAIKTNLSPKLSIDPDSISIDQNSCLDKKFHFFNWSNLEFRQAYCRALRARLIQFINLHNFGFNPTNDQIDLVFTELYSVFLKSAREAEKSSIKIGKYKKKKQFENIGNQEIDDCLDKIKKHQKIYRDSKYTDQVAKMNLKFYKNHFKEMQDFYFCKENKKKSFLLDYLIREKKNIFWKKISKYKKEKTSKNLVISKVKLEDFSQFYENLFSHSDRPSNEEQVQIENIVTQYKNSISENLYQNHYFTLAEISDIISKLSLNVACGIDGIINEFIKYGESDTLTQFLGWLFNSMIVTGHVPVDFNISVVTPIPKKTEIAEPGDARPISVSSALANILESLILNRAHFLAGTSSNQLGYKQKTSCKHAFYLVNETIVYYTAGKSPMHIISLDASKAFDKLWRAGLFYKLMNVLDPPLWRILFNYYDRSKIVVKFNRERSETIRITEGVKQGGILSPFLFNYYIDDLLRECLSKNIGALVGDENLSIIGYCDDLILLSPIAKHLEILLGICEKFAEKWKLEFNAKKSVYMNLGDNFENFSFEIKGKKLPVVEEITYLGLVINKKKDYTEFFDAKFRKVEKSFYSLYGLGCRPKHLHPKSTAFVYKQYCQSTFTYGLECLYLSAQKINEYNIRQNIMLKQSIGLSKYALSTPLLNVLKIQKISELYFKYKLIFYKQIMANSLTKKVFYALENLYKDKNIPKFSFLKQINLVNLQIGFTCSLTTYNKSVETLTSIFSEKNIELCKNVSRLLDKMDSDKKDDVLWSESRKELSLLLYN
jgi:hypothetical protein